MNTFSALFEDLLRDVYYAEKTIHKTLPKMMKKASSEHLQSAFEKHRGETEVQIERLEKVFETIGRRPQGKKCPAIEGILEEGAELMDEMDKGPLLDAALVGAAQAVEHYEIARYGTLVAWAELMSNDEAVSLLRETLDEEQATDEALTSLANDEINAAAFESEGEGDDADDSETDVAHTKRAANAAKSKGDASAPRAQQTKMSGKSSDKRTSERNDR